MQNNAKAWYPEILLPGMKETLSKLQQASVLTNFYLGGGTGLALQLGHRQSIDLDFFCQDHFDEDILLQKVETLSEFSLAKKAEYTLHAKLDSTKISFLGYKYPLIFPLQSFSGVGVADIRDIAAMKITAISSRGSKRDFLDVYIVAKQYPLTMLFEIFKKKYAKTGYSMTHILKSLVYFDEAENQPMPKMLQDISWTEIKTFFLKQVPRI